MGKHSKHKRNQYYRRRKKKKPANKSVFKPPGVQREEFLAQCRQEAEEKGYVYRRLKVKIYPNQYQANQINDVAHACDLIWNHFIDYVKYLNKKRISAPMVGPYIKYVRMWLINPNMDPLQKQWWTSIMHVKGLFTPLRHDLEILADKYRKAYDYYAKYHTFANLPDPPKYRTETYPTKYLHFKGSQFDMLKEVDDMYIKVPIIKSVMVANKEGLPDNRDLTSGLIVIEPNGYYVTLTYRSYDLRGINRSTKGPLPIKDLAIVNEPRYIPEIDAYEVVGVLTDAKIDK